MNLAKFNRLLTNKKAKLDYSIWLFSAYRGKYDDSPKAVSEYLQEHHPNIKIMWLVKPETVKKLPIGVTPVDITDDVAVDQALGKAGVVVDNIMGPKARFLLERGPLNRIKHSLYKHIAFNKKQIIISFWHGMGLKRSLNETEGLQTRGIALGNIHFLLNSADMVQKFRRRTMNQASSYVSIGSPRNDKIIAGVEDLAKAKEKLGLPADKKVILYAPTFRGDTKQFHFNPEQSGVAQFKTMDVERLVCACSEQMGGDFILVLRFHHLVEEAIEQKSLTAAYGGRVFSGNVSSEMADYLAVTDVLITDYSSSMFDFVATGKPIFLFAPDYSEYRTNLLVGLEELPFPCAFDFSGLLEEIKEFSAKNYALDVKLYLSERGYEPNAFSTRDSVRYIFKLIGETPLK